MCETRGNVKTAVGKTAFCGKTSMPSSSEGGAYKAIRAESAQSDSTEVAYDTSAMKVMTGHKASTNQKHGPPASLHK